MKKTLFTTSIAVTAALALIGAGCTNSTSTSTTTTPSVTSNVSTTPDVAVTPFDENTTDTEILADVNGQWATSATASSEYGTDNWAAKQATGKPNVTAFGDNAKAWAPLEKNGGEETLELSYADPVSAVGVRILESYGNGTLTEIELRDTNNEYHSIWSGTDTTSGLEYIQVEINPTEYDVDGIKLTFDTTTLTDEWAEIDAVQLVGE